MSAKSYLIRIRPVLDGGDRIPDLSPREALERWLSNLRVSRSESTVSAYHYRLKHFIEFCEERGITRISDLTGWDIETFETTRRDQGVETITLNNELGTLKNFFEYCVRIELVDEDLPNRVNPPDVPPDEQVNEKLLHPDDAKALLNYYENNPEDYGTRGHVLLALAWYTGARLGALRGLDLGDYDSEERYLMFVHRPKEDTPLKNGTSGERVVALPSHVCDIVDEYIETHRLKTYDDYGRRPLMTSQIGRGSKNAVRAWMYLATVPCLYRDCPHGNQRETCDFIDYSKASQCPSSRSPHQVRTGSITWQLNRGIPTERVAERVNTSIEVLNRHYDQAGDLEEMRERRREFIDRLDFDDGEGMDE